MAPTRVALGEARQHATQLVCPGVALDHAYRGHGSLALDDEQFATFERQLELLQHGFEVSRDLEDENFTVKLKLPGRVLGHNGIGIEKGLMTTIHAYTNDQVLTDVLHKDLRRARSATMSQIPTKTGAAAAVGMVLPDLNGKLDGFSMRVPTINVSVVDLAFEASRATTVEEVNAVMKAASEGALKGVLEYNDEPLVSIDFNHHPASSIFDAGLTRVMEGNLVKVLSWYDNEWGFSCRMLDTTLALLNA